MDVCLCCEHDLVNCGFVCVMLVNEQLQYKAIKHVISGHKIITYGSQWVK